MTSPQKPQNLHDKYHAHVYFDQSSLEMATVLSETITEKFGLHVGRVHQKPVGPHTKWSFQILFFREDFDALIPWLDSVRGELSVLVHADTGDDLIDHTTYAYWLGKQVPLNLDGF
jgi:DOPA 4,5-dioxygenase